MSYVRSLWGNFTRIFTPSFVESQSESPRESEVTRTCLLSKGNRVNIPEPGMGECSSRDSVR